nr:PREDICTED: uncharacterized protein LOC109040631 [Bemisia tabaci]
MWESSSQENVSNLNKHNLKLKLQLNKHAYYILKVTRGGAFRGPGVPRVASVSAPPAPAPVPRQSSFTGWTGPMVPRFQGMRSYDQDRRTYQQPSSRQYQYAPRFDPTTPLPSDEIFERLSEIPGLRAIPSGEINVRTELFRWRGIYVMRTVEAEPSVVSLLIVLTRVAETMSRIQGPPVLLHHDVEFDVATGNLYRTQIWTSRTSLRDYVGYDPPRPIRYLPIAYRGFLNVLERLPEAPPAARIPSPTRGGSAGVPSISSGIVTGRPRHRGALYSPPPSPPRPAPPPTKPKKIVPPYPTDTPAEDEDAEDTCCICCERVQNTRYMPCKHQFCFSCTEEIRKTSPFKCPNCRCVVDNYGKIPSDSD